MDEPRARNDAPRQGHVESPSRRTALSKEEVDRLLEEARRRGREEPGRITILVPPPRTRR